MMPMDGDLLPRVGVELERFSSSFKRIISRACNSVLQLTDEIDQFIKVEDDETRAINSGRSHCTFTHLPDCCLDQVVLYLQLCDVGSLLNVSLEFRRIFDPNSCSINRFWLREYQSICSASDIATSNAHLRYLEKRIEIETYEISHWRATCELFDALQPLQDKVTNLSCNVGRFPSREIAEAVTRRRPQALCGIIIEEASVANDFRRKTNYRRAVNFMPTNTGAGAERPIIVAPGFVGYATELIELRPNEEYLRESVLASLVYRDLTVWESADDVVKAKNQGLYLGTFFCVLNDQRDLEIVMDDDAPRRLGSVATMTRLWPRASYTSFRPNLGDLQSATKLVFHIEQRITSLKRCLEKHRLLQC